VIDEAMRDRSVTPASPCRLVPHRGLTFALRIRGPDPGLFRRCVTHGGHPALPMAGPEAWIAQMLAQAPRLAPEQKARPAALLPGPKADGGGQGDEPSLRLRGWLLGVSQGPVLAQHELLDAGRGVPLPGCRAIKIIWEAGRSGSFR
jgi:hypothetical protein